MTYITSAISTPILRTILVHKMSLVYPLKSFISLIRADLISSAVTLCYVDTMGFGSPTSCPTWWVMYEYASTKSAWLAKNISVLGVSSLFDLRKSMINLKFVGLHSFTVTTWYLKNHTVLKTKSWQCETESWKFLLWGSLEFMITVTTWHWTH